MDDLPEELLSSILSRLSVKDLFRLKATCKPWNSLISDQHFVEEHAGRERFRADIILSVYGKQYKVGWDSLIKGRPSPDQFSWKGKSYDSWGYGVIGCCNGLLCLGHYYGTTVLLWNPATREVTDVIPLRGLVLGICGFGYDRSSGDYKIVEIREPGVARLYSLKTNSVKHLQKAFPWEKARDLHSRPYGVYLNGHLHWPLLNSDNSLVSFNLRGEKFSHRFLLPGQKGYPTWLGVGAVEDRLCVYLQLLDGSCEVWVMKEYGVRSSWTRLLRSEDSPYGLTPLAGMPDGRVVFRGYTMSQTMTELSWDDWPLSFVWVYKESMVSPRALSQSRTHTHETVVWRIESVEIQENVLGEDHSWEQFFPVDSDSLLNDPPDGSSEAARSCRITINVNPGLPGEVDTIQVDLLQLPILQQTNVFISSMKP